MEWFLLSREAQRPHHFANSLFFLVIESIDMSQFCPQQELRSILEHL